MTTRPAPWEYTQAEWADFVRRCEAEAGARFDRITAREKAEYDATLFNLLGTRGDAWDRARDAAKARWKRDTATAAALYDRTVDCLLETGEISEALDEEWEALERPVMQEAAE